MKLQMRIKFLTVLSLVVFLFGCENPTFQNLSGIYEDEKSDASSTVTFLAHPTITYDASSGYLSWNPVEGAKYYWLYIANESVTSSMTFAKVYNYYQLNNYVKNDYQGKFCAVRAEDGSGNYSAWSNVVYIQ